MKQCKSTHEVRYICLALLACPSGWELSVHHMHMDQDKIRCPEDRYQHLTGWEAISLALDVAAALAQQQDLSGQQLELDF